MVRSVSAILFLLMSSLSVYGQSTNGLKQPDSTYLENDDSLIVIKLSFNNEYESFTQQTDDFFFDIRPNVSWMNKLSVSYRFISASMSFKLPFIPGNDDDSKRGSTEKFGFSFRFSFKRWTQELHIGKTKGFYLYNTSEVLQDWDPKTDPYFLLPNLAFAKIGGSTTFQLNSNFSLKALSTQTQRQLKSCGSPVFTVLYDYYRIENEGTSTTDQYQVSDNFEGLINAGYYHTLVLKRNWYAGLGASAGAGFVRSKVELYQTASLAPQVSIYSDPLFQYRFQGGLGYNARRVVSGIDFTWSDATRREADTSVRTNIQQFFLHIFIGYKLGAPGILKKGTDKAAEMVPLLK